MAGGGKGIRRNQELVGGKKRASPKQPTGNKEGTAVHSNVIQEDHLLWPDLESVQGVLEKLGIRFPQSNHAGFDVIVKEGHKVLWRGPNPRGAWRQDEIISQGGDLESFGCVQEKEEREGHGAWGSVKVERQQRRVHKPFRMVMASIMSGSGLEALNIMILNSSSPLILIFLGNGGMAAVK